MPSTSTEDPSPAAAVNNAQSESRNSLLPNGPKIQQPGNWDVSVHIKYDEGTCRNGFIRMLESFTSMRDGRLGHTTTAIHGIVLDSPTTMQKHSITYLAGTKEREFEKNKIDNMPSINVIEKTETE